MTETPAGVLLLVGGAEDKLGRRTVLRRFVDLAGGPEARIAVIATASALGEEATQVYREVFTTLGVKDVRGPRPVTRAQAEDPEVVEQVASATAVWMTGGNQSKLAAVIARTALGEAIKAAYAGGAVVGGTSAGASGASTHMIAFGAAGPVPKQRMTMLGEGLGLIDGVVVDQHFTQRDRIGRLMAAVAQSPGLLGVGIDEDTGMLVTDGHVMEVVGRGVVTVVDGSHMHSDAPTASSTAPLFVSGAVLHSLPAGSRYDLDSRTLLTPVKRSAAQQALADTGEEGVAALNKPQPGTLALLRRVEAEGSDDRNVERADRRRERRALRTAD